MLMIYYGHRVTAMDTSDMFGPDLGNAASPEALDSFLIDRRSWTAVTLTDLGLRGHQLISAERPHYILTFDDGYLDNLTTLMPILERHNVPAAIFVTTGFVSAELEPYEYVLARLIRHRRALELPNGVSLEIHTANQKSHHYEVLRRKWKTRLPHKREKFMTRLQAMNSHPPLSAADRYILNWGEVRKLDEHPLITIGAHSHTHPVLTRLSPRRALSELGTCRALLEAKLNRRVDHLAYPYGNSSQLVRAAARHVGFATGFSTEERPVNRKDLKGYLALPRFELNRALNSSGRQ